MDGDNARCKAFGGSLMLSRATCNAMQDSIDNCLSLFLQGGLLKVVGCLRSRVLLTGLAVGLGGSALFRVKAGNLFLGLVDVLHNVSIMSVYL